MNTTTFDERLRKIIDNHDGGCRKVFEKWKSLDFDIRFDFKSISSHARRGCCSQPGASLEIDFKSLKGGMSRHEQGLKIDFKCFLVHSPRAT